MGVQERFDMPKAAIGANTENIPTPPGANTCLSIPSVGIAILSDPEQKVFPCITIQHVLARRDFTSSGDERREGG